MCRGTGIANIHRKRQSQPNSLGIGGTAGKQTSHEFEENTMSHETKTLYDRLGGYDAITAVANDLLPRLQTDPQLGRFWAHRGEDGVKREKQLLIDFLCASAGGPMYYRGRDMVLIHRGMRISESDWNVFLGHAAATLAKFQVPEAEQRDVVAFVQSLKKEIVE
jgi:hemoglobin